MIFDYKHTLIAISYALDCVEHDIAGVTTNHGKRVAALSLLIGDKLNLFTDIQSKQMMCICALMHDCALSEYIQEEYHGDLTLNGIKEHSNLGLHCTMGEETIKALPYPYERIENFILYHHENANGTGPFNKHFNEIPLESRIIHIADTVDTEFGLETASNFDSVKIAKYLSANTDVLFGATEVEAFLAAINENDCLFLNPDMLNSWLDTNLPDGDIDCTPNKLITFSSVFARIIDYKSPVTSTHSTGIANKAYEMAKYYGASEETAAKLYFAGAMHDIGKLVVDKDILEKPDRLNAAEYRHIQTHVEYTYKILSQIPGIEDITRWASRHHEKLDGSGYPFGLKGSQMDKWEHLMACLDIYQALSESRPYKDGMSHSKAISIMNDMVSKNQLDGQLVNDIDKYYSINSSI